MALTDVQIRNTKPRQKPYKLFDGDGLFLLISPNGKKWWRVKYRLGRREKSLSLGDYPSMSLAEAREECSDARKQIKNGIDPSAERQARKVAQTEQLEHDANTFEVVARQWHRKFLNTWVPSHAATILARLQSDVFPYLGSRPVSDVNAPELLTVLRRIEDRGALETAHRVKVTCGHVFRYAIAEGCRTERNPVPDLKDSLPPVKKQHLAAITDPVEVAGLMRAIDGYSGSFVTRCALQFAPLVFVRPGELRQAEWAEVDFDAAEWNIPAPRMKMKQAHLVPLSRQAVAILRDLHNLTGRGSYVFPGERSYARPMSENAINAALRRMGYAKDQMTGHGFRAMARTILDEVLNIRPDFIEHQLAHAVKDPNGRAYNRTSHLPERRKMMQTWADYLDGLKEGAKVLSFRAG